MYTKHIQGKACCKISSLLTVNREKWVAKPDTWETMPIF